MDASDRLRRMVLQLEEITKCAVCLEPLRDKIAQCCSGHGVCLRCRGQINVCPTCRQQFLNSKPTLLIQVLEVLPKLCPYTDNCKDISFTEDHQLWCEQRPFKCNMSVASERCSWVGPVKNFKTHVHIKHNNNLTSYTVGNTRKLYHKQFKSNWTIQQYLHSVDENIFLVLGFKDRVKGTFNQSVRHIPLGEPKGTYYFVLTISKKDSIFKHTLKAVTYDEYECIDLSPHCMAVPLEEMYSFLNSVGNLEVNFEVIKKKE